MAGLSDEQIDEIVDEYLDQGSVNGVAEELGYTWKTVKKHLKNRKKEGDPRLDDVKIDTQNTSPDQEVEIDDEEEWAGRGDPAERPFAGKDEAEKIRDFMDQSPGDFLWEFFSDLEVNIQKKFIDLQAKRADRRMVLPTRQKMREDLQQMSSGTSHPKEIDYVTEEYWAEAQLYLRVNGHSVSREYADHEPGQQQNQDFAGGVMGGSGAQPQMSQPQGQPQDPQMQMMQMMWQQLQQQQQQFQEFMESMQNQGQAGGGFQAGADMTEVLEKVQRQQELLNQISGGGEEIARLEQHLQKLQQAILEGDASQRQVQQQASSLEQQLLLTAATQEGMDLREVWEVVRQEKGASQDPEVMKLETEKEMKKMELEHQEDRIEKLGGLFEKAIERGGREFGKAISSGGESESEPADDGQQEPAGGDTNLQDQMTMEMDVQPDEPEECDNCGSPMISGPSGTHCNACGFGYAQCDECEAPFEVPPIGKEQYGFCPDCGDTFERPQDIEEDVLCPNCDWEGEQAELSAVGSRCEEGCGTVRPIERQMVQQAQ